ncbi:MAG: redoxin domain-containing protein [Chloroflexi bacterium]|nr:redoxin domain-containing protein [Chloroflexota bacterium]
MFVVETTVTGMHAPEFKGIGPWINSPPLTLADLRGRVVLVDFWTYTCINCLRTLPDVLRWHRKYADAGLVVVGIHTPEFDFEQRADNVVHFVHEHHLRYPIALDNERALWQAYGNHHWPHKYLIDARGTIRFDHAGEGAYTETEGMIRLLLNEARPNTILPEFNPTPEETSGVCLPASHELYAGYRWGRLANPGGYVQDRIAEYTDPGWHDNGQLHLHGEWEAQEEFVRHARATDQPVDYVGLHYQAFEVNAILRSVGETPIRVEVVRDGHPVSPDVAGRDVRFDEHGASYVEVVRPRLYQLISDHHFGAHSLRLATTSDTLDVYAFSFGGCSYDPLVSRSL